MDNVMNISRWRRPSWEDEPQEQLRVLRELLCGGEIVPAQLPSPTHWSPGLRLAAAVLAQAMADIRLRRPDGRDHIHVNAAVRWVRSDDASWPLSFLRICELFHLEPRWVRGRVARWMRRRAVRGRHNGLRQAA
jgi:hypothetical protein